MANNITGASLNEIYNRLNGTPRSTPMGADTFNDWSMEAGDKVKVSRDGKEYETQVHTSTMIWKGQPQTTINSSGNEKRDPVAKISKRKYSSGTGGMRNGQEIHNDVWSPDGHVHSSIDQTASTITAYVEDTYKQMKAGLNLTSSSASLYAESLYNQMKSGLDLTSSTASLYVTNAYKQLKAGLDLTSSSAALYVDNAYKQMKAGLNLTSSSAGLYVRNMYNQMSAGLRLTSSSLSAYVKSDYDQMKAGLSLSTSSVAAYVVDMYKQMKSGIALTSSSAVLYAKSATNAAEIVARINESTGESEIHLNSDKVFIGNERSTTVINGKCSLSDVTAEFIQSKLASLATLEAVSIHSSGNIGSEGSVMASNMYLATPGEQTADDSLMNAIKELQITRSDNTYYLQKKDYGDAQWVDVGNFSRAVSSWSVSSDHGTLTLTANPQNQSKDIMVYQGSWSRNGNTFSGNIMYSDDDGEHGYETGSQYSVDATSYVQSVQAATGLVIDTENSEIRREYSAATKSVSISAKASISYNSSTHKYTATAKAKAGNTEMDSVTETGGTEAYSAGGTAAGVVIDTENGEVRRELSTSTKAVSITSKASISYSSSTHKYTATAKAKAGSTTMDTTTDVSGTEAWDAVGISSVSAPEGARSYFTVTATAANGNHGTQTYYIRMPNATTIQIRQGNQISGRIVAELDISD